MTFGGMGAMQQEIANQQNEISVRLGVPVGKVSRPQPCGTT